MAVAEQALKRLIEAVHRAILRRLEILHGQCEVLANDMLSAKHLIETERTRANLDDIRVGTYHRYSTELERLQWFMKVVEPSAGMRAADILLLVEHALEDNIATMRKQYTRVSWAMGETLQSIGDDDGEWDDIRIAAWYKASTEGRVYKWLSRSLASVQLGEVFADLDPADDDDRQ